MIPPSDHVHWWFATGLLVVALLLLAEATAGAEAWRRRAWRPCVWPGFAFGMGLFMWPVMTFFTRSTMQMLMHGVWAQALMLAGAAELALARGKVSSPFWLLPAPFALAVSGTAFLIHEPNPWLYDRTSFVHHGVGWTLLAGAAVALARFARPRSDAVRAAFAGVFVVAAVFLYAARDRAPIFGHAPSTAAVQQR